MSSAVVMATINLINWWDAKTDKSFDGVCVIFVAYNVHLVIITHYQYRGTKKKNPDETKIAYSMSRIESDNPTKAHQGYVDWANQVDIPNNKVMRNPDGRDIYCYPGRDLRTDNYNNKVIQVQDYSVEVRSRAPRSVLPKILPWLLWEQCGK